MKTQNPEIFQMLDRLEAFIQLEQRRVRGGRSKSLLRNLEKWTHQKQESILDMETKS